MNKGLVTLIIGATMVAGAAYAGCGACGPKEHGQGKGHGAKTGCAAKGACMAKPGKAGAEAARPRHGQSLAKIHTNALNMLLKTTDDIVLLDARSGKYDDGKRIPGAKTLTAASSEKEIRQTVPNKDALIVAYCSNVKCPASAHLARRLQKEGYKNVIKYPEGIEGWIEAGHDIETVK